MLILSHKTSRREVVVNLVIKERAMVALKEKEEVVMGKVMGKVMDMVMDKVMDMGMDMGMDKNRVIDMVKEDMGKERQGNTKVQPNHSLKGYPDKEDMDMGSNHSHKEICKAILLKDRCMVIIILVVARK